MKTIKLFILALGMMVAAMPPPAEGQEAALADDQVDFAWLCADVKRDGPGPIAQEEYQVYSAFFEWYLRSSLDDSFIAVDPNVSWRHCGFDQDYVLEDRFQALGAKVRLSTGKDLSPELASAKRYMTVSRVGFNAEKTKAVLLVGDYTFPDHSGGFEGPNGLKKENGQWAVIENLQDEKGIYVYPAYY